MTANIDNPQMASPDQLMELAKLITLGGRDPQDEVEWTAVMSFIATAVLPEVRVPVLLIMSKLYDVPLPDGLVAFIAENIDELIGASEQLGDLQLPESQVI